MRPVKGTPDYEAEAKRIHRRRYIVKQIDRTRTKLGALLAEAIELGLRVTVEKTKP